MISDFEYGIGATCLGRRKSHQMIAGLFHAYSVLEIGSYKPSSVYVSLSTVLVFGQPPSLLTCVHSSIKDVRNWGKGGLI